MSNFQEIWYIKDTGQLIHSYNCNFDDGVVGSIESTTQTPTDRLHMNPKRGIGEEKGISCCNPGGSNPLGNIHSVCYENNLLDVSSPVSASIEGMV